MFETHTSYINEEWNYNVINEWKNGKYTGSDELYKNQSAYLYVKNHLGYRIVLNECEIPKTVEQGTTQIINVNLKNVGAGNVVNEKDTYLIIKNETNAYAIPLSLDVRTIMSNETYSFNIEFPIEKSFEEGNYDIYLKVLNKNDDVTINKRTIRFANEGVWDEEIGANKLGSMTIIESSQTGEIPSDQDSITSSVYNISEKTISKISPSTTISKFKENVENVGELVFVDSNGTILSDNDIIKTGTILKVGTSLSYELVVKGDLDGDGTLAINDIARMKLHIIGNSLEGIYLQAANLDSDDSVTLNDFAIMKLYILDLIMI